MAWRERLCVEHLSPDLVDGMGLDHGGLGDGSLWPRVHNTQDVQADGRQIGRPAQPSRTAQAQLDPGP